MRVSAIFDKDYEGALSGAVWLLDTPENRNRFEGSSDLDRNSALFSSTNFHRSPSALIELIWTIHDHFPELKSITVIGVKAGPLIARKLETDYAIEETIEGFVCSPASSS